MTSEDMAAAAAHERIPFHPLADLFPLMEGIEFDELVADIKLNGLEEVIVMLDDQILDGRNRYLACLAADVEPLFVPHRGDDPLAYVISANLRRRHMEESQQPEPSASLQKVDRATAAKLLNVSERTVAAAAKIVRDGVPELVHAVEQGAVSVSTAAEIVDLPVDEQRDAARGGKKAVIAKAKKAKGKKNRRPRYVNAPPSVDPEPRHDLDRRLDVAWECACPSARSEFLASKVESALAASGTCAENLKHQASRLCGLSRNAPDDPERDSDETSVYVGRDAECASLCDALEAKPANVPPDDGLDLPACLRRAPVVS
jgi:hypothetical protein